MLDKSLPYVGFIMKMRKEKLRDFQVPVLPEGFFYKMYEDGNQYDWARLEARVNEFDTQEKALTYFENEYSNPYCNELYKRCVFVCNPDGVPLATATAWFMSSSLGMKSWLQWIACDPDCQGRGLGRAVIAKALSLYRNMNFDSDIYLHTQSWSHKAVYLYWQLGFELFLIDDIKVSWHREPGFRIMKNEPLEALEVMSEVYTSDVIEKMRSGAEMPVADELCEHALEYPFPDGYSY